MDPTVQICFVLVLDLFVFGNWLFCFGVSFKGQSLRVVFDYLLVNFVGGICCVFPLRKKESASESMYVLHGIYFEKSLYSRCGDPAYECIH